MSPQARDATIKHFSKCYTTGFKVGGDIYNSTQ